MKRLFSTMLAVVVLLGLGALAMLAVPGGAGLPAQAASALAAPAAQGDTTATQPEMPAAAPLSNSYNLIALPLDSTASISPFTAAGLAAYVGSNVKAVIMYDSGTQGFKTHTVGSPFNNFSLTIGGAYFLEVDATPVTVVSFVGGVPDPGTVVFTLARGATPSECRYNAISVPLDKSTITLASELAAAITGVNQVVFWDAGTQGFKTHTVGSPFNNLPVKIGYPYFVCVNSTGPATWY